MSNSRARIHIFVAYFLPGSRAGGPTRSVANLVQALADRFTFRVYCLNHDLGSTTPYESIRAYKWRRIPGGEAMYLPPVPQSLPLLAAAAIDPRADVVMLNSLFERRFSMLPLCARALASRGRGVVLAPRGELSKAALANKTRRKSAYISALRMRGWHQRIRWIASSEHERRDILAAMGNVTVLQAPPLPTAPTSRFGGFRPPKTQGRLRAIFVGRLLPHKGLHLVLKSLARAQGSIHLDVAGPIEDAAYWKDCHAQIGRLPERITVRYMGVLDRPSLEVALSQADLMVLPTRSENFCHAIAEALAAGVPVLTSDGTPWRNLEEEGVGWDIPLAAESRFVEALDAVTAMEEEDHQSMRQRATAYALRVALDPHLVEAHAKVFELAASD